MKAIPLLCFVFAVLVSVMPATQASAQSTQPSPLLSREFTKGEWAVLPEYCIDTMAGPGDPQGSDGTNGAQRSRRWVSLMGHDFWNMHHYCYALRDLRRAEFSSDPRVRGMLYMRAEGDLGYVIGTSKPSMVLMPEVFLKLGELRLKAGNISGAEQAFDRARELRPDYWPAYTSWIDVLIGLKQIDSAKKLTAEGLQQVPDNEELRKRAAKLQMKVAAAGADPAAKASEAKP